ncbi:histidine kinase [Haloglomus litoreum]|uniref:histidine kinase n=1 Tax=Haloglomus litoreum TaxID=3034026 RepID=UPI0023E7EB3C|nr:histidine kinase [Haloglomus sp. DT116]
MNDPQPSSLSEFIDEVPETETSLIVLNRTGPEPLVGLLRDAFGTQEVSVSDRQLPEGGKDLVLLVREGRVVATSHMERLQNSFLLINADRYRTGTHGLQEANMPDVLIGLDEIEFEVRGFPASNKEKLLLVLISRFIEGRALRAETGRFDVSFQRFSRLDDEYGTRKVYRWLGDSGVDTHVYGVRDEPIDEDLAVTPHAGTHEEYRHSWFVVFRPPADEDGHVALVALETGDNVWRAMWTYDPDRVARIGAYVQRNF